MAIRDDIKSFVTSAAPAVLAVPTPEIPQWDGQIFVTRVCPRAINNAFKDDDPEDERARWVVEVASDAAGSRIFQAEDVLWLSTTPYLSAMVERLYWAGREINGLTAENREGWRKNLPATAASGSPCSSAAPATPATASASTAS
jgi:hypothetical protein